MAAAPAIVKFVGGTPDQAMANTAAMGHITIGRNGGFALPPMSFAGTPAGIDARKVVDTGFSRLSIPGLRIATQAGQNGARHYAGTARLLHEGRDGTRLDRAGRNAVKERHGSPLVCHAVP